MAGKRDKVKDEDRYSIIVPDLDRCIICGSSPVQLHEVFEGDARRPKCKEDGLVVPLCFTHHNIVHRGDGKLDKYLKQRAEKFWIYTYCTSEQDGIELFIDRYGKNYL